ncbi:MAG: hypothetical protein GY937_28895 [bacterium]|nr:hypothetical protein [bacterium]
MRERSESRIRCVGSEPNSWAGVSHSILEVAASWVAWRRLCPMSLAFQKEAAGA